MATVPRGEVGIEVARIEAGGVSVLAGRAPPGSRVTIRANGRVVANAMASGDGQWSTIVLDNIEAGDLALAIVAEPAGGGPSIAGAVTHLVVRPGTVAALATAATATRPVPVAAAGRRSAPASGEAGAQRDLERFAAVVNQARSDAVIGTPGASEPELVPVPITFVTDAVEMTVDGIRAANLLAEYLRLKRPTAITLSGHADARGTDSYNLDLSRRRLMAIEHHLRERGFSGQLTLLPKGKSEPFGGVDRERLGREAVWQADRRVELRTSP